MTNVMIVEDQELQRRIVRDALTKTGRYQVLYEIDNAEICDVYLLNQDVDLIIMDVFTAMGADGIEAAERIKQDYPEIRIIVMTSNPEAEWVRRSRAAGVESFWYKEVNMDAIVNICDRTMAGESVYALGG